MRVGGQFISKLGVVGAGLAFVLAACGDDKVTGGADTDATNDVFTPDADATDISVDTSRPDTTVPDTTPPDTTPPDTTPPDTTPDTTPPEDTDEDTAADTTPVDTRIDTVEDTTPDDTVADTADTTIADTSTDTGDASDTDTVTPGSGESCGAPRLVTLPGSWTQPVVVEGDTTDLADDQAVFDGQCPGLAWDEGLTANDEVWALTAPKAGVYAITLESADVDLGMYVLTDCPAAADPTCAAGSDEIGVGVDAQDVVHLKLAAAETVFVVVDAYVDDETPAAAGAYTLTFAPPIAPAAGDECAGAQTLALQAGVYTGSGTTALASTTIDDLDGEACGGDLVYGYGQGGADQVWRFVAPSAGDWHVVVTPSDDSDPLLYAFVGAACTGTCTGPAVDDFATGEAEGLLLADLTSGETVSIVVDTFIANAGGAYTIAVSSCAPECVAGECGNDDGCGGTCGCDAGEVCGVLGVCEAEAEPGNTCADAHVMTAVAGVFTGGGDLLGTGVSDDVETGTCELLGEGFPDDGVGTPDEVWSFVAPTTGSYTIEVTSAVDSDVFYMLFDGPGCADAACDGYVDNGGSGEVDHFDHLLTAGKTYVLVIDTWADFAAGAYDIHIAATCVPVCDIGECGGSDGCGETCGCGDGEVCDTGFCIDNTGDTCVAPYEMLEDEVGDFSEAGDLSAANVHDDYVFDGCEVLDGFENTGRDTPDEVFTFEIATAGDYVVGVSSDPGTDTAFALFEGDLCGTATCAGQIDNGGDGGIDVGVFTLPAGAYSLVVDAIDASTAGSYFVLITPYVPDEKCAPDLFFSEYVESGAGSNKALEIFNGTGHDVDLAGYQIWRANNGDMVGPGGKFDLEDAAGSPVLADGQTWTICHSQADDSIKAFCDQEGAGSLLTNFNGDDYIGLVKLGVTPTVIDVIGVEGEDPGAGWEVGLDASTEDFVLWRDPDVSAGSADWEAASASEWFGLPAETLDDTIGNSDLGEHLINWICTP